MARVPHRFLDAVVAVGEATDDGTHEWSASGFLYGHLLTGTGDQADYAVYLVTNRHVTEERDTVLLRFNPEGDGPAEAYTLVDIP